MGEKFIDVRDLFPFASVETIEILEKNIEGVRGEFMRDIDLALHQEVRVDAFTDYHTLDVAKRESALSR